MENWGLDLSGIQLDDEVPTGEVRVTVREGEPQFRDHRRTAPTISSPPTRCVRPKRWVSSTMEVWPCGPLCRGRLSSALRKVSESPVLMDVNLRDPWWNPAQVWGLMDEATWVKLNEDELVAVVPG